MRNIFLVKSPLQLLNAVEAKHHFRIDDDDCILVIMGDRKSYPQLMSLSAVNQQWRNVLLINNISLLPGNPLKGQNMGHGYVNSRRKTLLRSSFFTIWRLNRLAKFLENVERIFIGDYNYVYMRHMINTVRHKHTVLLDDGTATVEVARMRLEMEFDEPAYNVKKRAKLVAKQFFQGLKSKPPEKLCFFTAFELEVNLNDKIVKNYFQFLKNESQSLALIDSVYFLGSPLVETGVMIKQGYLDQLSMVNDFFKGKEVVYVAHRREDKEKLAQIQKELNMKICIFDYPIEYQVAILGPTPKVVASFICSALDNLRVIMDKKLKIISFKLIDGSYLKEDRVNAIYDYYDLNLSDNFCLQSLENIDDS